MKTNRLKKEPPLFEVPKGKAKEEPMRNSEGHILEKCPNCFQTGKIITVEKTVKRAGRKDRLSAKLFRPGAIPSMCGMAGIPLTLTFAAVAMVPV